MKHVQLNNIEHKNLKIITERSEKYGDKIGSTLTFPTEFAQVQSYYPIFFRKDSNTGEFQSVVLFGFDNDENLFLDENGWDADYIPIALNREPFLIGFQNQKIDGEEKKVPVIHFDEDNPRVSEAEGEPVFLEQGGNSAYLDRVCRMMDALGTGIKQNKLMFSLFQELELIEPLTVDVTLDDGTPFKLSGYYTVSEEKLAQLDAGKLDLLNKNCLLFPAYMVVSSTIKIGNLVKRKNQRIQSSD